MKPLTDADLLQAFLDGRLADDEVAVLEARLVREPALADTLVSLAREEAILAEWVRAGRAGDGTAPPSAAVLARDGRSGAIESARPRRPFHRRPAAAALLLLAAAAILLAVLGVPITPHRQPGDAVFLASLEDVEGDVSIVTASGAVIPARRGYRLCAGQELRTGGEDSFALVTYADRTRLELSPDTLIRLVGDGAPTTKKRLRGKRIFLNEGTLAVDAVEQPEDSPMVLVTPHAEATFRKSTFTSCTSEDATRIELDDGPIEFTRTSDGRSIVVPTACYAVAAGTAEPFAPRPLPVRMRKPRALLKEVPAPVLSLAYAADGKTLAIGCRDGSLRLCDPETGRERVVAAGHKKTTSIVFSRDGRTLAALIDDRVIKVWDTATLEQQMALSRRKLRFVCLALSPDGKTLAAGCADRSVRFWDTVAKREAGTLRADEEVYSLAFSPDGELLATGGGRMQEPGALLLWEVATRTKRASFAGHRRAVRSVAFSPDGQILASGSDDGTVRLWDPNTGQARRTLDDHAGRVLLIALSPDGRRLASVSNHTLVRCWDVNTGQEFAMLKARKRGASSVAFAPDNTTLATGGWDKTIRLWDIAVR